MSSKALITKRFAELQQGAEMVGIRSNQLGSFVHSETWQQWATSVLNLFQRAFGEDSVHFRNFSKIYNAFHGYASEFERARGVFRAARSDYLGGYTFTLETAISGEIFGDFVALAKQALRDGYKDVAAVLSCAALEDALKRYAARQGLAVGDKVMQEVISALKASQLVGGAQKTLLDTMPKIRDYAMHANWSKIQPEDVNSVIGFVEQFLITKFSE
jgi:hypothetical protein